MISYTLRCRHDHEFEVWFKDSAAFLSQRESGHIECPVCGDRTIEQGLSRPSISSGRQQDAARHDHARQMRAAIKKFRKEVEKTHENVGDRFAEEARRIHYGDAEKRDIYGEASIDEASSLIEEGVKVAPLPWVEDSSDN